MKTFLKIIGILALMVLSYEAGKYMEKELSQLDDLGKPTYKFRNMYFDKLETRLYLKTITWGITGNHSQTVLTLNSSNEFFPDSTKEYIFEGNEIIYRQTPDSLIIYYGNMISKPKTFNSPVKVRIIESTNYHVLNEQVLKGLQKFY